MDSKFVVPSHFGLNSSNTSRSFDRNAPHRAITASARMLSRWAADVEYGSRKVWKASRVRSRGKRGTALLTAQRWNIWQFRRGPEGERCRGPSRPRHQMRGLATSGPSARRGAHCVLNTAMHPCVQVLPDESL